MKILKILLGIVITLVVLLGIGYFIIPDTAHLEKSVSIDIKDYLREIYTIKDIKEQLSIKR